MRASTRVEDRGDRRLCVFFGAGATRYAVLQLAYMSSLAYVVAFAVRQGLMAAGFGG